MKSYRAAPALKCAFLLLFGSFGALAANNEIQVQVLDPGSVDTRAFGPGFQVHSGVPEPGSSDELPSTVVRDGLFAQAGLNSEIASWDELERDILYRRAKRYDLEQLKSYYPSLAPEKLQKLREAIHGASR